MSDHRGRVYEGTKYAIWVCYFGGLGLFVVWHEGPYRVARALAVAFAIIIALAAVFVVVSYICGYVASDLRTDLREWRGNRE